MAAIQGEAEVLMPSEDEMQVDLEVNLQHRERVVVAALVASCKARQNLEAAFEALAKDKTAGDFAKIVRAMSVQAARQAAEDEPDREKRGPTQSRVYKLVSSTAAHAALQPLPSPSVALPRRARHAPRKIAPPSARARPRQRVCAQGAPRVCSLRARVERARSRARDWLRRA